MTSYTSRTLRRQALAACVTVLGACTTSGHAPEAYLRLHGTIPASPQQFRVCNLPGCRETSVVALSDADWRSIHSIFQPPADDSASERERIATAIARFERLVADQAGTWDDQAGQQGVLRGTRQLDCVAETSNTTAYLVLLRERGLMQWHAPRYPQHRGFMHGELPHNTAVIEDVQTGQSYAVDAYFHANGVPPEIVPLPEWLGGFKPE